MLRKKEWLSKWPGATSMYCWQRICCSWDCFLHRAGNNCDERNLQKKARKKISEWDPCMQILCNFYSLLNNASCLWGVNQSKIFKDYLYVSAYLYIHWETAMIDGEKETNLGTWRISASNLEVQPKPCGWTIRFPPEQQVEIKSCHQVGHTQEKWEASGPACPASQLCFLPMV